MSLGIETRPTRTLRIEDSRRQDTRPKDEAKAPPPEATGSTTSNAPARPGVVHAARAERRRLEDGVRARIEGPPTAPPLEPDFDTGDPTSTATPPSSVAFGERAASTRRSDLSAARDKVLITGDASALDDVDTFRGTLSPSDRPAYDQHVEDLRNDDRITFTYQDGAHKDPVLEDLALRGIAAQTFRRPEALERVLETATNYELEEVPDFEGPDSTAGKVNEVDGEGRFDVYVYPANRELGYSGGAPGSGDLTLREDEFYNILADQGENLVIHEFGHVEQGARSDGTHEKTYVPEDFPDEDQFREGFESAAFQQLLADRGLNGDGLEAYPTASNLFKQSPDAFRAAAPDFYATMAAHFDAP